MNGYAWPHIFTPDAVTWELDMPLFEVDARRSTLVQPLAPSDTGFVEQAAPVVDDHVSRLLGEQIFPVAQRPAGVRPEDAPHLLALDAAGQPVVLEMVARLDAGALALALAHAGRAGRLTRAEVAERFPDGVAEFERAYATFRDGAPLARTRGQREGARLLLLCAQVDPAVTDALDFLRLTSNAVTVLRLGVVTGPDGRRLVEVEPLYQSGKRGRAGAAAADAPVPSPSPSAASASPAPSAGPTRPAGSTPPPPTRTSTRSARLPTPPGDLARAALAQRAAEAGSATPPPPSAAPAPSPAPAPSAAASSVPPSAAPAPSSGPYTPATVTPGVPTTSAPLPTRRSRAQRREDAQQAGLGASPSTPIFPSTPPVPRTPPVGSAPPQPTPPQPTPPPPTVDAPVAPTRTPVVRRSPVPLAGTDTDDETRISPRAALPERTVGHPHSAPLPVPSHDSPLFGVPTDDDPDLFMLAQNLGRPTVLVWSRPRRGQRFEAILHPVGQIELPGRGRYRNPDAAASAASGQEREDGWDVWRLGDDGQSLTEVFRQQFA